MPHVHGKPGEFARTEADKRFNRIFNLAGAFALVGGFVIGLTISTRLWWLSWAAIAPFAIAWVPLKRKITGIMATWGKDQIKYWRGAQGESLVAWFLQGLDEQWHVFHGVQLAGRSDIDHIVIGPAGFYCISTKSDRGLFSLQNGLVLHNNKPTGLIGDTMAQTMRLKDRLGAMLGSDLPFITAVLAVPLAWVEFNGPQHGVWVLHQANLMQVIENANGGQKLTKEQIGRCVTATEMLAANAKRIYRPQPSADQVSGSAG